MSRRERKRYVRRVKRKLKSDLKESKKQIRDVSREQRAAARTAAKTAGGVRKQIKARSKAAGRKRKAEVAKLMRAGDTCSSIGYRAMFENGICEVAEGLYSETLVFDDITYQSAREEDQRAIMAAMGEIYNYLSPEMTLQYSLTNRPLRQEEIEGRVFFDPGAQSTPSLAEDATTLNRILSDKLREGVSNIERTRHITIAVEARNPDEAYRRLARINTDLAVMLEQIGCNARTIAGAERLYLMSELLRPGKGTTPDYSKISCYGNLRTKDLIAPMAIDFAPNGSETYWRSDGVYCQVLAMRDLDSPLDDSVVKSLADMQIPINITLYLTPYEKTEAIGMAKRTRALIDQEIINEQQRAVQKGYDYSILPAETTRSRDEADSILAQLEGQNQRLFHWTGLVYTWAGDEDALLDQALQIIDTARAAGVTVEPLEYRQREGMNSVLPLGRNLVPIERPLLTNQACIFVPFATQELDQPGGSWYYQNRSSNNLVFGNRATLSSPVGFISGRTGSGKGFFTKNEILGTLLSRPSDQVIVFDRAGEYRELVEHAQGSYATFGVGYDNHLNPLGREGLEHLGHESMVANKASAIIAQASAAGIETGSPLTEEERSIIQRCVEHVFDHAGEADPILGDFVDELKSQPEPAAAEIALRYERYTQGVTSFFNSQTNLDFDKSIIGLNFKEVPESMVLFSMICFCETVRAQMFKNYERGRRTWLYIEELESLFKYPTVIDYFRRFANECRKYGMFLTGITQSTESMIRNPEANAIVKNADFVVLLRQSKEDRDYWAEALGLSDQELAGISDRAPRGSGLLVFGAKRIPIKGDFPQDNHIYKLFSTDPNEREARAVRERLDDAAAESIW